MNDDERLAALFRDAASDANAPPPSFEHDDVVATSRRITARRRSTAVAAAVAIGLAGMTAAIVIPTATRNAETTAAAPMLVPDTGYDRQLEESGGSADAGAAGSGSAPEAPPGVAPTALAPLGPGQTECADRQDPALRTLVEQVLPEVSTAGPAATPDVCLPGEDRYLALEVTDGGMPGILSVSYLATSVPQLAPGSLSAPTASGGTVIVGSTTQVPGATAPFADRLPDLLAYLAPRL